MKLVKILIIISLLIALLGAGSFVGLKRWGEAEIAVEQVGSESTPIEVKLTRGAPLAKLSAELHSKGVINSAWLFRIWVRFFNDYSKFKAGSYRFEGAISPERVAAVFIEGKTHHELLSRFTIPEGFTVSQVVNQAVSAGVDSQQSFDLVLANSEKIANWTHGASTLEGYLFPATYYFYSEPTAEMLLEMATAEFWKRLPTDYQDRLTQRNLNVDQAVIIASMIERETKLEEERTLVSEVIQSRLAQKLPLGIDATVIYGIVGFNGNLTRSDLKNSDNLYNTRIHQGLPPTAIGSPSLSSLLAVLNPASQGYLYYVVDGDNPKAHRFARTLEEHNQNVAYYLKRRKERQAMGGLQDPSNSAAGSDQQSEMVDPFEDLEWLADFKELTATEAPTGPNS